MRSGSIGARSFADSSARGFPHRDASQAGVASSRRLGCSTNRSTRSSRPRFGSSSRLALRSATCCCATRGSNRARSARMVASTACCTCSDASSAAASVRAPTSAPQRPPNAVDGPSRPSDSRLVHNNSPQLVLALHGARTDFVHVRTVHRATLVQDSWWDGLHSDCHRQRWRFSLSTQVAPRSAGVADNP